MIGADDEYPRTIMPESHWEALMDGCAILIDEGFADPTTMNDFLPPRYEHLYDAGFLRRFLVCLLMVHHKLKDPRWYRLACVGEELALSAAIQQAKAVLELAEKSIDDEAFRVFQDSAFKDLDFEWLYEQALDGVESDPELGEQMRIMHLHPTEWFMPFDEDEPVHPFIEGPYELRKPSPAL